jgi:hypothetical protein
MPGEDALVWARANSQFAVVFHPHGPTTLHRVGDGHLVATLGAFDTTLHGYGLSVSFSPQQRYVVVRDRERMELWDVRHARLMSRWTGAISDEPAEFSPDGSFVALRPQRDDNAQIVSTADGRVVTSTLNLWRMDFFTLDGRTLLIGTGDDLLEVVDASTGGIVMSCAGDRVSVESDGIGAIEGGISFVVLGRDRHALLWRITPRH